VKLKKMTDEEIGLVAAHAMTDAVDFVETEISPKRVKAQRYFNGASDLGHDEGRSKVVATKVRDHIRAVKPSLLRVFLSTENPVEYLPETALSVAVAEQATKYAMSAFHKSDGYGVLNAAFHDALLKKNGVVKAYWADEEQVEYHEFHDLTPEELTLIVNDPGVEVLEHEETPGEPVPGPDGNAPVDEQGMLVLPFKHYLKIARTTRYGSLKIVPIPPEEFFIDRNASSLDDAYIAAHRTEMRVGDLVAMGFDFDEVSGLSGIGSEDTTEEEEFARRGYDQDYTDQDVQDPSMKLVAVTEAYMRIDADGTGRPVMHKLLLGGNDYKLLEYEKWGPRPFAVFEVDPEPHTFYGRSLADLLIEEQDVATSMLRGVIDNVHHTNNPRMAYLDGEVNVDDLLNNEIGGLVRMNRPDALQPLSVPFVAGQTLGALQYFDQELEAKTGVTRASTGLNPDALQSSTATAVQATVQAAAGQVEVMARNLAEGGMRQLFRLILRLIVENANDADLMRIAGDQYQPVDPRSWNLDMDVSVNVGLGTGREEQKLAVLGQTLQLQLQILQQYGMQNGIVTLSHVWHTLSDTLALNGLRNATRYFTPVSPQLEAQILQQQQAAAQQPPPPDPQTQAFLQVEQLKVEQRQQADLVKAQADLAKAQMADDRERDRMDMDLLVKAAEILGNYGVAVDVAQIQALQAAPRAPQMPQQMPPGMPQ
jgi:hypothetical protein